MINVTFTRHKLTPKQLAEIKELNCEEIGDIHLDLTDLASKNISSTEEAESIYKEICERVANLPLLHKTATVRIYGVFPAPIREQFYLNSKGAGFFTLLESFNVNRSKEGEKPSFEHLKWCVTGHYRR